MERIMKNTSNEGLTASYLAHKEESDQIIKEIKGAFADKLTDKQKIARLELENQELRNQLLMGRYTAKR